MLCWTQRLVPSALLPLAVSLPALVAAQGTPIGFVEDFALATDRAAALASLAPGTDDYYYFHCLHAQHTGDHDQVAELLRTWIRRHGRTARVVEIETRQALLAWDRDPDATVRFVRERLDLRFADQRQVPGEKPDLPTRLDPSALTTAALDRNARARHPHTLDGFSDGALRRLAASALDDDALASLLGRLDRPDAPNLPALVARDLARPKSRGFGSHSIHHRLLLEQLEECASLRPQLLDDPKFVEAWVRRLRPNDDVHWQRDVEARERYLERLESFVSRLPAAHNSLRGHVLYHRLAHDLARGVYDEARLRAYLRLPSAAIWVDPEHVRRRSRSEAIVEFDKSYPTGMPPIRDDERVVRACLAHFLLRADSRDAWADLVRDDWLRVLFAETKILAGIGDQEQWYSLLDDPAAYERLEKRVDLEFAPTQSDEFGAGEGVKIELDVKNVETLLVKVFEIDTYDYHREQGRDVDIGIDLAGLVANEERTVTYDEHPLRRVRRTFEFPRLDRPGTWVVEFVGNGRSSRALVRKGRLHYLERSGAAGHVFTVVDAAGRSVRDATAFCAGREFTPDEGGEIVVPYTTNPGRRRIVLQHGRLSTIARFEHGAESYELLAGVEVDRESLIEGATAHIVLRPSLRLGGRPVAIGLLEEPEIEIVATDAQGIASTRVERVLDLTDDRESVHEIRIRRGIVSLQATLRGRVRNLSQGKTVDLEASSERFAINGIDATAQFACPLLVRGPEGYAIEVRGKSGEAKVSYPLRVWLTHEDYTDALVFDLQTDASGRIALGRLPGIRYVRASEVPGQFGSWDLRERARTYPASVHGVAGEELRIPYAGAATAADRAVVSVLEVRGGVFVRDASSSAAIEDGFVVLRGLAPGDYDLALAETGTRIDVRVTEGASRSGWAVGRDRVLRLSGRNRLHVTNCVRDGDRVRIALANAGADTRVHVVATRYVAGLDALRRLAMPHDQHAPVVPLDHALSVYDAGREIGDEYRYILDRRYADKYPGNLLRRPGLLLNPWVLEETETGIGLGGGAGGGHARGRGGSRPASKARSSGEWGEGLPAPSSFANLDFLPAPSRTLANLRPDDAGQVVVALADLGPGHHVHVLAIDGDDAAYTTLALPEPDLTPRTQELAKALDTTRHFTEQRRIELVDAGTAVVLEDATTTGAATYDSLASVFRLFQGLNGEAGLEAFAFVLDWPKLTAEQQRELYSEHACHELHVFLHEKDPEFFRDVLRPYLANKLHRTFLDDWLLDADLTPYVEPRAFARLNVVERILLTRSLEGRRAAGVRHVRELLELVPPDAGIELARFAAVLDSGALDEKKSEFRRLALESEPAPDPRAPAEVAPAQEPRLAEDEVLVEEQEQEQENLYFDEDQARERDAAKDVARRRNQRGLYRPPGRTREYVEHNYWHMPIAEQNADLIDVNAFWLDFAESRDGSPFVSAHVADAAGNFAEMMLALAFLDLPFASPDHEVEVADGRTTLRAAERLLAVRRQILEAELAVDDAGLLVSQNYYRLDDRYEYEANRRRDKFVTDEFLVDVVYGCQVVLTNPSSAPRSLDLLLQIPAGAIPVQNGFRMRNVAVELGAFSTSSLEYLFYFPRSNEQATHFPVHVSSDGTLLAAATPTGMRVVETPSTIDTTSWEHVSQNGNDAQVVDYLENANLQRTELGRIAWRMRDREFFDRVIDILRERHAYEDRLWSYSVLHRDVGAMREYLRHAEALIATCGSALESPLLSIDPVERRTWQHIEYEPLFNSRAHPFAGRREILNHALARQYLAMLDVLSHRASLDSVDWMGVTYYMLLQDRITEALAAFDRVERNELPARLQHDAMRAHLAFFTGDHGTAQTLVEAHKDHPVSRWRAWFRDVDNQLAEAAGAAAAISDIDDRTQEQNALAASGPMLELSVEARRVTIRHRNLEQCEIGYYPLDVEFSFSTSPFVQQGTGAFAYVYPNRVDVVTLASGLTETTFDLPAEFASANVLVEVRGGGITRRQSYFANSLSVQIVESFGQLRIANSTSGDPMPRVYVKVYSRDPRGGVRFHKDGYTDLRGVFDYASISDSGGRRAERFAILVLSEEDGAQIREVAAPGE